MAFRSEDKLLTPHNAETVKMMREGLQEAERNMQLMISFTTLFAAGLIIAAIKFV